MHCKSSILSIFQSTFMLQVLSSNIRHLQFHPDMPLIVAIVYRICTVARASNAPPEILYDVCRIFSGTGMIYTLSSLALVSSLFKASENPFPFLLCDAIVRFVIICTASLQVTVFLELTSGRHHVQFPPDSCGPTSG